MCDFFVGQKVVCICSPGASGPIEGEIYQIKYMHAGFGRVWLELVGFEYQHRADWFRPLVEAKNDISELRALLATSRLATVD